MKLREMREEGLRVHDTEHKAGTAASCLHSSVAVVLHPAGRGDP